MTRVLVLLGGACCLAGWLSGLTAPARADDPPKPKVGVVLGPSPSDLERYAAEQLCAYLDKLYAIKTQPATRLPNNVDMGLLVGGPKTNPAVAKALGPDGWPKVTDQGIVLKRANLDGKPVLVIGGGSPAATLWAVYELVERWGVRYLLHGDVLPQTPGPFQLPGKDVTLEPNLRIRQWRVINEHAMGPVSWGMDDYRPVLDQLAKLKFNRLLLYIWPLQPFVHYEAGGISRRSATLFFGLRFPITDDMPGRRLFGAQTEFWNPDIPRGTSYKDFMAAGRRHMNKLIEHARRRGMQCVLPASLGEFPPEFAPLLKNPQKTIGVGDVTLVPGANADVADPGLNELAAAILKATVNTYPQVDFILLSMQEHRQWAEQYRRAWKGLDARYGVEKVRPLAEVLAAAGKRTGYPGGAARAVQEVKGDIVALHFYDRLLNDVKALKDSRRPNMRFIYDAVAEELYPILPRIVPKNSETLNFVDYTPSRIVKRREVLKNLPSGEMPSMLIYTLHDDNVGVLPQLATGSLHELTKDLRKYGWAGFSTRYWLIGDHDPCVAYLARAAWDRTATPEAVYRDQIAAVCGPAAVELMLDVYREVEAATIGLEQHGLGLTFTVPGMIMQHWRPEPLSSELVRVRRGYLRARQRAKEALAATTPAGKAAVAYWIGRLDFGHGYLAAIEQLRHASRAEKANKKVEALKHAEAALATMRQAIEAFARVARDQSDRGAIATMGEFVYRPLKKKVEELRR